MTPFLIQLSGGEILFNKYLFVPELQQNSAHRQKRLFILKFSQDMRGF